MLSLRDIIRTPAVRLAAIVATGVAASTLLLFMFIFWRTAITETQRIDHLLERDAHILASESPRGLEQAVQDRVAADFHRLVVVALFDQAGHKVVGNLDHLPVGVPVDGLAHSVDREPSEFTPFDPEKERIVAVRLMDGRVLAVGRNADSLEDLRGIVLRALLLGVAPAVLLSLACGAIFGYRAQRQITAVHTAAERIIRGNLQERLPSVGAGNDFGRLVNSVNHMLDEVGVVIEGLKSTSQNIAHDLRTPLTRVRLRLEQSYHQARNPQEYREAVDRAIEGLDQALRIITSLLRMGQMDSGRGRDQFRPFDLKEVILDVGELYQPLAADKQIVFAVEAGDTPPIWGDRDLLMEAIVNVVDNALKFTPSGGRVRLEAATERGIPVVRVTDNGPGIAPEERAAVMQRFFRSGRTSCIPGSGLGLSLVDSIARLHGFTVVIRDARPGCIIELICRSEEMVAVTPSKNRLAKD